MATLEHDKKLDNLEDPRAARRVLSAEEGEALLQRLSEPARKPTLAMVQAVRAHKRLLSEPSAR